MPLEPTDLLIPVVHLVTLLITATSAIYVYRQKTTEYPQVRNLLVMVHIFYMGVVSLEFARTFVVVPPSCVSASCLPSLTDAFLTTYTISNTSFVLADVFLLTLVAVAIFYRPNGRRMTDILREVGKHQMGSTLLIVYATYIIIAEGWILAVPSSFQAQVLPNLIGATEVATSFDPLYLDMLLGILLVFLVYPSGLLIYARRRTGDTQVRRAFAILPIAWVGIGIDLLVFNGYLLNQGIDASSAGYLFAAAAFSATAATFRRATLLSAFFQPGIAPAGIATPSTTFSGRLGLQTEETLRRVFLVEVDSSSKFEEPIKDFANELGSTQRILFAFTASGSPVYNALLGLPNVRFFTMTRKVSYPKPGDIPEEVLVPSADQSVLLNVLDKAITSNPDLKFGVVFDSVSDLILTSGLEVTYKFLKQANEMLNSSKITAVFLLTGGAHSDREVNVVKSLFSNIVASAGGQLVLLKGKASAAT
ncbi:MAG TPA: hypothetical protein VGR53_10455 [Nitrososphaerales archaeon]|nr:hypothetical protein [Nitrososphaerales archaeon]